MRKKLIAVLGVGAIVAVLASAAFAAVTVTFKAEVKPAKANKPAGLNVRFESKDPAADAAADHEPHRDQAERGRQVQLEQVPALQACGAAGARARRAVRRSRRSAAGTGIGYAKPVVTDPVNAKLTIFNGAKVGGKDTILVYVFPDLGPTFVSVGKISKKRSGGFDYNLDFNIPPIKTLPSAPDAATALVDTKTPKKTIKKGKRKFSLIVTPKKCKGTWKAEGQFFFADGSSVTTPVLVEVQQVATE